ncbi:MAG TPA: hypothetical protein VI933_01475 [archaeon]|nr:hypothetical protein [archaeon]
MIGKKITAAVAGISSLFFPAITLAHCPLCAAATGGLLIAARAYGVSDLITGTLAGAFSAVTAIWIHNWLKAKNKNKSYFPFQGIIFVLASILLTVLTFQFVG